MINITAEVCGLMICLLLAYFVRLKVNNQSVQYKWFNIVRNTAIINLIFEIFSAASKYHFRSNVYVVYYALILFEVFSNIVLYTSSMFCYSFVPSCTQKAKKYKYIIAIPYAIHIVVLLTSQLTKWYCYIDENRIIYNNEYIPLITTLGTFFFICTVTHILHYNELTKLQKQTISLIMVMPLISCTIETITRYLVNNNIIRDIIYCNGFAYACVLLVMYTSFYSSKYDSFSGYAIKAQYLNHIRMLFDAKKNFTIFHIKIENGDALKSIFTKEESNVYFASINKMFSKHKYSSDMFYLENNSYALVSNISYINDINELVNDLKTKFEKQLQGPKSKVEIKYSAYAIPCGSLFDNIEHVEIIEKFNDFYKEKDFQILNENDKTKVDRQKILYEKIKNLVGEIDKLDKWSNIDKIDTSLIEMYYQPILHNSSKKYLSAEALMRLNIEELGGIIYPNDFIPYLESMNYIHNCSCAALANVCKYIQKLQENNKDIEGISVNFSLLEFVKDNFENDVLAIVNHYQVDPSNIHIEITETIENNDIQMIKEKMFRLKEKGFKFYLDDFGTGYSNLAKLTELPFDVIKFDKSLVDRALVDNKTKKLIKLMTLTMTQDDTMILYEGIEDELGEELMKETNVTFGQGYKYSKPINGNDAMKFFSQKD